MEKTKLNSNSQQIESVNTVIRHALPQNMTFARNFSGRVHRVVFKCNNGPGEAKQLAVLFLQTVKCGLEFWPNRNVSKRAKRVGGPQKERSSINLGEIIFTCYMKSTKRKYLIKKPNCLVKKLKQGNGERK